MRSPTSSMRASCARTTSSRRSSTGTWHQPWPRRWSSRAKRAIRESRVTGTRNLIEGLRQAEAYPHILISSSAIGYYGARGEEPLDEDAPAGRDFLAKLCVGWEAEAAKASALGV